MPNIKKSKSLISLMAARPIAANVLMMTLIICGTFAFYKTKKEVFPEFGDDSIEIETLYPGASPQDIETSIILPIENSIMPIASIKNITSNAEEGRAIVVARLYNGENISLQRQIIQDYIGRIDVFPDDAKEPTVQQNINKISVLKIILYGLGASEKNLKNYADKLYDHLKLNKNIGPIEIKGLKKPTIYVDVDKNNLKKYKVSLTDVAKKINEFSVTESGGVIETNAGDISLRISERRDSAHQFGSVPIIDSNIGKPVMLSDIASIHESFDYGKNKASFMGMPAVAIDVFRIGSLTPKGVSDAVLNELKLFDSKLPSNIATTVVDDRSIVFQQRADLLMKNGVIGLFLVLCLLGAFLGLRFAFWIGLGIPISFFGAFLLFPVADISINMVTMFAFIMCLGIVVDDAIIVGENIFSYRRAGYTPLDAAIIGAREVASPVSFSVITNIVAFLPLFFVPGVMGKIFIYIPAVVVSVFFISLIESLFILPAHLASASKRNIDRGVRSDLRKKLNIEHLQQKLDKTYDNILLCVLDNRYFIISCAVSLLFICFGYVSGGRMGLELFPDVESDIASVTVSSPPGVAMSNLIDIENNIYLASTNISENINNKPISKGVFTTIDDNVVQGKMFLTDASVRSISTREVVNLWRKNIGSIPGADSISYSVNDRGPGAGADLTIKLSHSNTVVLKMASIWLSDKLRSYEILSGIEDGIAKGKRQWSFVLNDNAMALGISSQQIASQVKAAFYGVEVATQHRGKDEIDVVVRLPKYQRDSEHDIKNFILHTNSGAEVMLGDIVDIREGVSYSNIDRENGNRVIVLTAEAYPKSDLFKVQEDLDKNVIPLLQQKFPDIKYEYAGKQTEIVDSLNNLAVGLSLALLIMYALLIILFNNLIQPLIILLVIPFSFVGVLFGHLVLGYSLSVLSLFGVVALTGIVINDGVILMHFINNNLQTMPFSKSIILAARRRFFPVVMTTVTTFVGLLPIILERSMQAKFLIPMAISLAFGVLFAMIITLVLIPAICSILDDFRVFTKT